ncbi:IPT/TIG domain-containing protein [Mucilaginibacter sp. SP1R1]|uniref:NHL domain-containing protein n=1 Tax=Mucilaginibacter sp. SP1R1 TaxID=2723091 RepID=UPI00161DD818|nr:IPT/TIG domain-containing protein [Mucilaginibacter sp. SP1R1]MBB6148193.1 sugar lactone lactonase YvrE [Mucilaginibacter sp. SP1R1]
MAVNMALFLLTIFFIGCSKRGSSPTPPDNTSKTAITALNVNTGPYNTTVIITGTGFSNTAVDDQVFFNGKATIVSVATSTQLTVTVPLAAGTGNVTLKVKSGNAITGPVFTYQASWVVSTLAGSGAQKTVDGTGTAASFTNPDRMTIDAKGNLYLGENFTIRKITPEGVVSTIAGTGKIGSANGNGTAASFFNPGGMVIDKVGDLYVADYGNNLIRKMDISGNVTTLAGTVSPGFANGKGTAASFSGPVDLVLDKNGNTYVADLGNEIIRKITSDNSVTTFSKIVTPGKDNVGLFHFPGGLAIDNNDNLYATDIGNFLVQKITPAGIVSTVAGSGIRGSTNGQGTNASFNSPRAIIVDKDNTIYVTDGNVIRKIDATGVVTTFAGSGAEGAVNGPASTASFKNINGIVADKSGNLYVSDTGNNLIRKISFQ